MGFFNVFLPVEAQVGVLATTMPELGTMGLDEASLFNIIGSDVNALSPKPK
jgi:hypothetical protein